MAAIACSGSHTLVPSGSEVGKGKPGRNIRGALGGGRKEPKRGQRCTSSEPGDAAAGWYERLTARPPDLIPNAKEAAWQLTETSWVYIVADADRAGSALNTLLVDDLDAFLAGVAARGIAAGPIEAVGASGRQSVLTDPDGNRLKVAHVRG